LKVCVYGNPTIDIIVREDGSKTMAYGGGSYYSSLPLLERGWNVEIYASFSPLIANHPIAKYIVKEQYSTRTNIFVLEYRGLTRSIRVLDQAPPLHSSYIHSGLCVSIVNPVLREVSISLLKAIRSRALILALDLQGFVRGLREGSIVLEGGAETLYALQVADIIHADIDEIATLYNKERFLSVIEGVCRALRGVLVVTDRPSRFIVVTSSGIKQLEIEEDYVALDKTGAGDYFLTSYTIHYMDHYEPIEPLYKAHQDTTRWLKARDSKIHRDSKISQIKLA